MYNPWPGVENTEIRHGYWRRKLSDIKKKTTENPVSIVQRPTLPVLSLLIVIYYNNYIIIVIGRWSVGWTSIIRRCVVSRSALLRLLHRLLVARPSRRVNGKRLKRTTIIITFVVIVVYTTTTIIVIYGTIVQRHYS